ncbi:MAG: hypothetical protein RQ899_08560 [Pseudomonadales bacterium]|nr:hypothetical protein [Pseudomonadales bacterium]
MPPVMLDVEVNGKRYDEMHADGGVQAQFFVPLVVIDLPAAIREAQAAGFNYTPTPRMFVIRNSKFLPDAKPIERKLGAIVDRTVASMVQAMGRADLFQIYAIARARGNDFRYTEIPADFQWQSEQEFHGPELRRLYAVGYENGQRDDTWVRTPPGVFSRNLEGIDVPLPKAEE